MKITDQEQEGQQGVAARPPERPLREAGAAGGLPGARRLQAQGDRRGAAACSSRASWSSTSARRRAPGASTCGASFAPQAGAGGAARRAERHDHRARHARLRADRGRDLHRRATSARTRCWPQLEAALGRPAGRRGGLRHGAQPVGHRSVRCRAHGRTWSSWRSISRSSHLKPEGALVCKVFHGSGYSQLVEAVQGQLSGPSSRSSRRRRATSRPRPSWSASASRPRAACRCVDTRRRPRRYTAAIGQLPRVAGLEWH